MAYIGKYIDRNPTLASAGVTTKLSTTVNDSMKIYSQEEAAEDIIKTKCRHADRLRLESILPRYPFLPEENLKDILSTELKKSRFVAFREKFSEDMYFKKPELGKALAVQSKPDNVTNDSLIFGHKISPSESAYDLMFPRKSMEEVNREYIQWHDKYVISHRHYLPSEQIRRHYADPFNRAETFGDAYNIDVSGKYVKKSLEHCNQLMIISKIQKEYLERTMGRLGRNYKGQHSYIPQDMTFGLSSAKDECNVRSLMENIRPCEQNTTLIDAIAHINKWRRNLFDRTDFHMLDLKLAFEKEDIHHKGRLPLSKLCEIARSELIFLDPEKIKTAVELFKLIECDNDNNEVVDYAEFWKLLHIQFPLPTTGNMMNMPANVYNETTYRALCEDTQKEAVLEPVWHNLDREEKTTAKDVIAPDIPMHYGLGPGDFERWRDKEDLRCIFKRVLTERFDELWERAKSELNREKISVDELRNIMNTPVKKENET